MTSAVFRSCDRKVYLFLTDSYFDYGSFRFTLPLFLCLNLRLENRCSFRNIKTIYIWLFEEKNNSYYFSVRMVSKPGFSDRRSRPSVHRSFQEFKSLYISFLIFYPSLWHFFISTIIFTKPPYLTKYQRFCCSQEFCMLSMKLNRVTTSRDTLITSKLYSWHTNTYVRSHRNRKPP